MNKKVLVALIILISTFFILSIVLAFQQPTQASGWAQVAIVVIGLPIVLYQLDEIRNNLSKKTEVDIGLSTTLEYSTADLQDKKVLDHYIQVSQSRTPFRLALRNTGKIPLKFMRVILELTNSSCPKGFPWEPILKPSHNFREKSFTYDHYYMSSFLGGSDFVIYPGETETFGFWLTTYIDAEIYIDENGIERRPKCYPAAATCYFLCSLWAEGLQRKVQKELIVKIVPDVEIEEKFLRYYPLIDYRTI